MLIKKNTLRMFAAFFSFVFIFSLSACSPKSTSEKTGTSDITNVKDHNTTRKDLNSITLLTSPWPPDALNYLAQEKGFFKKNGVNVELLWSDGYEDTFNLIESGQLDVWNFTLLDALSYHAKTGTGQAILVQDYSDGADAVVAMSGINNIPDLTGKKVGVEKGTVDEFFLKVLLEREGLILSDVKIIDKASEDILDALKKGTIAAGVCYEPCPTNTVNAGGKIIVDSKQEKNLIVDVYVGKKEELEKRKEDYVKIVKSIEEAADYFNNNPAESAEIMQKVLDMPKEEIISAFRNLRIPSMEENYHAFDRSSGVSPLDELVKSAAQYLEQEDLITESINTNEILNPSIIRAMKKEQE